MQDQREFLSYLRQILDLFIYFICVCMICVLVWGSMHSIMRVWRSENNLCETVPYYHIGHRAQIQIIRIAGKCLYLLSHLAGSLVSNGYCQAINKIWFTFILRLYNTNFLVTSPAHNFSFFLSFLVFWDRIQLYSSGWLRAFYVAQSGLKFAGIYLCLPNPSITNWSYYTPVKNFKYSFSPIQNFLITSEAKCWRRFVHTITPRLPIKLNLESEGGVHGHLSRTSS